MYFIVYMFPLGYSHPVFPKAASCTAKGGLLRRERPSLARQKAAFYKPRRNPLTVSRLRLRPQGQAEHEVGLLRRGVGRHSGEQRQSEALSHADVLNSLERHVGNGKTVGLSVEARSVRHGADGRRPLTAGKTERGANLEIRRIGSVAATVTAGNNARRAN